MKRFIKWMMATALVLTMGIAGAAEVLLGPGDVVKLSVYGSPDLSLETRVSETGNITFPLLGQVAVGGLPVAAAEKKIGDLLEKGGYLKKAQVNMLVTTLASQQVSVLGYVNRPGRYAVDGRRKVLDLLAMAGGMHGEGGDIINLVRTRNGNTTRETIDVVDMVRKGELNKDYEVVGGDIIYVERAPRAYVTGEVARPGPFRLERGMTVQQAVSAGGGLSLRGSNNGMKITRKDASGNPVTINVKASDPVQVDDVIVVRESWF
ncbi:polysaccharide export protein EpsE [Telluria aromaticivorans]|uniref:Polysaccharide export protein EpsE n=1 Tax=Telluria aromaticivorans TaxID=2725995 RepID=A0A7Y2JZM2_9BURK|nr:polysaccharide export protein EpsE [Telluria aromaticivorans]NNG23811.1 polysaccharide export protein EpsE [Telluria aromaticivorans]